MKEVQIVEVLNKNIFNALIKFQKDLKNPIKSNSADMKTYKYKFSPIEVCWDAVRENLANNGLAVIQFPLNSGELMGVKTLLIHTSGEYLETEFFVEPLKKDIQSLGGIYSYCRRYAFCMALGITPHGEDFDGKEAMPSEEDSTAMLAEIRKNLKLIVDKSFVDKAEKYIEKNNDLKILKQILGKVQEKAKGETNDL